MALEGVSSQPLRRPATASSLPEPGALAWATVHAISSSDTGQLKAAALHVNTLFVSGRKGIWTIDALTGRCGARRRAAAAAACGCAAAGHPCCAAVCDLLLLLLHCFCWRHTRSYEEFARPEPIAAQQALACSMCVVHGGAAPSLLWACDGRGAATIYSITDRAPLRKVAAAAAARMQQAPHAQERARAQ